MSKTHPLKISAFVVGNIISSKLTDWLGSNICLPDLFKKIFRLRVAVTDCRYQLICCLACVTQPQAACQHTTLWLCDPAVGSPYILGHLTLSRPSGEQKSTCVLTVEASVTKTVCFFSG